MKVDIHTVIRGAVSARSTFQGQATGHRTMVHVPLWRASTIVLLLPDTEQALGHVCRNAPRAGQRSEDISGPVKGFL